MNMQDYMYVSLNGFQNRIKDLCEDEIIPSFVLLSFVCLFYCSFYIGSVPYIGYFYFYYSVFFFALLALATNVDLYNGEKNY